MSIFALTPSLQQATTPAPAQAPIAAAPPVTERTVPQTEAEVRTLRAQRSEMSDQLTSALGRREELAEQIAQAPESQKPQLEARLRQLDERILSIETEIASTGQLLAAAPGQALQGSGGPDFPPFNGNGPNATAIGVLFTLFVMAPIAFSVARAIWRRTTNASAPRAQVIDNEMRERMSRLESGVDAIALEVERISEGQRFVTKLMAERSKAQIEAGRE